jgi:hypothetical protein
VATVSIVDHPLTRRQQRFVELCLTGEHTLVEAYRKVSPPRSDKPRSRHAESVEASRLFHNPKVQEAIAAVRDRDPVLRRYRALRAMARIAEGKLDPSCYRAARALQKTADGEIEALNKRARAQERQVLEGAVRVLWAAEDGLKGSRAANGAVEGTPAKPANGSSQDHAKHARPAEPADQAQSPAYELVEVIRRRQAEHEHDIELGRKRRRRVAKLVADLAGSSSAHPPGEFGLPRR